MKMRDRDLSLGSLLRVFWRQVGLTWALTLLETGLLATLPLLIGLAIDGLLNGNSRPFVWLGCAGMLLLVLSVARRIYDTRAYGRMRVDLGRALFQRENGNAVSKINARLNMSRELVSFLEVEAPLVITAMVQVVISIIILFSFHGWLAAAAAGATLVALLIYAFASGRFFKLNGALNTQAEKQVAAIECARGLDVARHLLLMRRLEVRLSDTEAIVYGLIFAVLMIMLGFNLWFSATQLAASPGQIFAIVTYSFEFIESAVMVPAALQSLTRISEITQRINPPPSTAEQSR